MAPTRDATTGQLVERAAALAAERLAGDEAINVARFIRLYYERVPPEDIGDRDEVDLYGAALAHYRFADERPAGTDRVRIYTPEFEQDGWQSTHTVVEVAGEDMPFLVDSVTMELNRHDWGIHVAIHPVIEVRRDQQGRVRSVPEGKDPAAVPESFIHIEVDRQSDQALIEEVEADLRRILADVRAAVEDWPSMRERLRYVIEQLSENPPPLDPDEVREAQDLLQWLHDDHFTFLGHREYELIEVEGEDVLRAVRGTGLGILRETGPDEISKSFAKLPPEVRRLARAKTLLNITKANSRSTVHRPTYLDYIGIKRYSDGEPVGEWRFLGLYTSMVYNSSVLDIPLLRRKVRRLIERAGYPPASHGRKDLLAILETYPRDALFQISDDDLYEISMGIHALQERRRVRLFVRRDTYGRFFSCQVFVPRDRYDTATRQRIQEILMQALGGTSVEFNVRLSESVLARLHFIIYTDPTTAPDVDVAQIEQQLVVAARSWIDELRDAFLDRCGEDHGIELLRRYEQAFPASYREDFAARIAVADVLRIEQLRADGGDLAMHLYHRAEDAPDLLRFKVYRPDAPLGLSEVLPLLEHMGTQVVDQRPYEITAHSGPVWIHDFGLRCPLPESLTDEQQRQRFQDTFAHVWRGSSEDDGFNRLTLLAGLEWADVATLRAYGKYLRQAGTTFSQSYIEDALANHAGIARSLVELFHVRFDPSLQRESSDGSARLSAEIEAALDAVPSLDEDRILRSLYRLVRATLRTSFFQRDATGAPKEHLSLKFDPERIPELPLPRPMRDTFVYSPRTEGIHLRGGLVARGGLRWSDRREDYRTEVLGLMKAQMVKNTVIVPVGAKGGFVCKQLPVDGDREAVAAEVVSCYRTFVGGLLDITDNLVDGKVVPPRDVVRYDGDDPYLVVAADKGTATFSDIANEVAADHGFWLGDAFASGGSVGYDHKKMGITARGAWESVTRHFLELGTDIAEQPFTVVGIGDMSGDVFGNGMLLSDKIRLVGAFNHLHVFIDPDPDPEASYRERRRLFELPRSAWSDYDPALISPGGGVWPRSAKSVPLSPQARAALGVTDDVLTPNEVIQAMLRAPVDLLWNGGIGTYVKAGSESHSDVGDKGNDGVRVNAADLRCRVVGEGGNLGFTQPARIEFALTGGRVNTDAIDNSAGVDCSDHEVNIKVLLDAVVQAGDLTLKQRNALLAEMTDEVADLVLRSNYDQNQALSNAVANAPSMVNVHRRYVRQLEQDKGLNRALEHLPDEEEFGDRSAAGRGLVLPEFAVLLAYTKIAVFEELLDSDVPDEDYFRHELVDYFPSPLRTRFREVMGAHRLRREIVANQLTNGMVNRAGTTFVYRLGEETGAGVPDIARAFAIARDVFGMSELWTQIESLDRQVPATVQTALVIEARRLVERASRWLLRNLARPLDVGRIVERFAPGPARLADSMLDLVVGADRKALRRKAKELGEAGVPAELARQVAGLSPLFSVLDLVEVATSSGEPLADVATLYFQLASKLKLDVLRERINALPRDDRWQTLARDAVREDLYGQHRQLVSAVLADSPSGAEPEARISSWMARNRRETDRCRSVLADIKSRGVYDLATLSVALREIRNLVPASAPTD